MGFIIYGKSKVTLVAIELFDHLRCLVELQIDVRMLLNKVGENIDEPVVGGRRREGNSDDIVLAGGDLLHRVPAALRELNDLPRVRVEILSVFIAADVSRRAVEE